MEKINGIAGVILAGGKSKRFGTNKALTMINGKPLIQHGADLLSGMFRECILVTNTPEEYEFLSLPMTHDRYMGCGPLAGIHAALLEISEPRAFVIACDMPNISEEVIRYICSINEQNYDVIIPWLENGQEPLFGIYHKNALPVIEAYLENKDCQIIRVYAELLVRRVREQEVLSVTDDLGCFKNINRPADI
jgi:molybdopterin-guanine dinucleotide biosynthesis protein A